MINSLAAIIQNRFLDADIALEVAKTSRNVWLENGLYVTNTFCVDAFVAEVKAAQGSETDAIRTREIRKLRARYENAGD